MSRYNLALRLHHVRPLVPRRSRGSGTTGKSQDEARLSDDFTSPHEVRREKPPTAALRSRRVPPTGPRFARNRRGGGKEYCTLAIVAGSGWAAPLIQPEVAAQGVSNNIPAASRQRRKVSAHRGLGVADHHQDKLGETRCYRSVVHRAGNPARSRRPNAWSRRRSWISDLNPCMPIMRRVQAAEAFRPFYASRNTASMLLPSGSRTNAA